MVSVENHEVRTREFEEAGISVWMKREDRIHPVVSGNKYRKLKYNLLELDKSGAEGLLTFGGAHSNHIAATAFACAQKGVKSVGIIRGEELKHKPLSPTLSFAAAQGMRLHFVSREQYRSKATVEMQSHWRELFPGYYYLPEGGTNSLAVKGCEEILQPEDAAFDYVCAAAGTGGTLAGIINASENDQKVLGFPALKGDFLQEEIYKFAKQNNWELITRFHFGGYAKINRELVEFINSFKEKTSIALDPVYTGKMMYGLSALAREGYFKRGDRVLAIHTGGLQGIPGMNRYLNSKNLPLIQ